ncbi:MAG: hypothetical protein K0S78_4380 [Thermomicrobiales bacterium]|jgi:hypothetical protein|nr:hypothetical protein [Thermomicrobiales bacterium]MDF3038108.1 hypothetical protein [Thermomicrobiales bacterium]
MSKVSYRRLGGALVSLAVPFMLVAPVAAQPSAPEVGNVATTCIIGHAIDISTCQGAVTEGVYEVVEGEVNAGLLEEGVAYVVDVGAEAGTEPGDFPYDINDIAINPLPPLPPAPLVPVVSAVPFQ